MPSIAVDAGPLIAAFRPFDRYHSAAKRFFLRLGASFDLTTNLLVVGEVASLLAPNVRRETEFLEWAQRNLTILHETDLVQCAQVLRKYADLPGDLADVSLILLCERLNTNLVASIDSDFDVYRLPRNRKFRNVFFDTDR